MSGDAPGICENPLETARITGGERKLRALFLSVEWIMMINVHSGLSHLVN